MPAEAPAHSSARILAVAAMAGYLGLAALGLTWWALNLGTIPAYGDTQQYFELADSLQVDQYRTLFYPLLLRGLRSVAGVMDVRTEWLVYALQTAAMLACIAYLGRALWDVTAASEPFAFLTGVSPTLRRAVIGAASVAVFTAPLVNHFALSVMTDALAAAFTTAAVGALVRIVALGDTRLRTRAVGWLMVGAAGFMRGEKIAVFALVVAATLAVVALHRRRASVAVAVPRDRWRTTSLILATFLLPAAAVFALNRATQTADHGWPAVTLDSRLFVRAVWPRLVDIRPLLSAEAQAVVSPDDAVRFDANYNEFLSLVPRLQRSAGGTDRLVNEISLTALRQRGPDVAAATAIDTVRYTLPMLAYPLDLATAAKTASAWTDSRMGMAHPTLTRAYLVLATVFLVAVQLPLLCLVLVRGAAGDPRIRLALSLVLGTALVNAVLYALGNGLPNVRYALPAYVLGYTVIAWANAVACTDAVTRRTLRERDPVSRMTGGRG